MGYHKNKEIDKESEFVPQRKKINRNNRRRGKAYERRAAAIVGGKRNLDKSRPHTDVETVDTVYEIKSTQQSVPNWLEGACKQLELAAEESGKIAGGVIKVWTSGAKSRFFLITEITDTQKGLCDGNERSGSGDPEIPSERDTE